MVRTEYMKIYAADMGKPNPLPDIKNVKYIHAGFEITERVTPEERKYLGKGMINTVLPYMVQDGYTREKKLTSVKTVVLENEYLKAVFLPDYGGRLWSLYDKERGRDMLYTNTVIQPCNFAILNAWLSGGVEFNIGIKGHTPLTCSPMFSAKTDENTVRFYEFERIRKVAYSITAYLPNGSKTLYIRPRIENTADSEVYMYWWTNIAFPETDNIRVIVPADKAIHCSYQEDHYVVDKTEIPVSDGVDVSYPLRSGASADYFYCIDKNARKWIAGVDKNGTGLLHYSDNTLKTRKLFLWGNKTGGRHWNEFLSEKGQAYIEIQAGLANTQLEHIPMPPHTVWEWTEGYVSIDGANEKYYGNWETAVSEIEKTFDNKISEGSIAPDRLCNINIDSCGGTILHNGSGWGALENDLRTKQGKSPVSEFNIFPVVNDSTAQFRQLLEKGHLPCPSVETEPDAYVADEFWKDALIRSAKAKNGNHWYTYLQLGVTEYALGNIENAACAWGRSADCAENVWALRNLAALYHNELNDVEKAYYYENKVFSMREAFENLSLLREYAYFLTSDGMDKKWIDVYGELSCEMRQMEGYAYILLWRIFIRIWRKKLRK